jgi:hypothetical protein
MNRKDSAIFTIMLKRLLLRKTFIFCCVKKKKIIMCGNPSS